MDTNLTLDDLGPVEQLNTEVFELIRQPGATEKVSSCNYCHTIYPYMVRGIHLHKDQCPEYAKAHNQVKIREDIDVSKDPAVLKAIAKEKRERGYDESMEVDFQVIGGEIEEAP